MEVKRCGACGLEKPITSFTKRSGRSGRRGTCRSCQRKRGRLEAGAVENETDLTPAGEQERDGEIGTVGTVGTVGTISPLHETVGPEEGGGARSHSVRAGAASTSSSGDERSESDERLESDERTAMSDERVEDMGDQSVNPDAGNETEAKPRKRKRRRRKKRAAAPLEPLPLAPLLPESDAHDHDEGAQDAEDSWIPLLSESERSAGDSDVALALNEAAGQPDSPGEPPARKRKRRRRRRKSKAKPVQTSALPSGDGERAEVQWLLPDEDGAESYDGEAQWQDASAEGAEEGHEEGTPPRKRKRRRRRKRRSSADQAAAAPARPQIKPPYKRIVAIKGPFKFDVGLLNDRGTGLIRLRGRRETGKRWSTEIPTEMAIRMVSEGAAGIINPSLIHKLYTKTDFRLLILQRDDYVCKYCGRFGDTIDHVMPKSKGGLSTPDNCVCACAECNLKKADHLDFVFDDF
ncbi:HNH endonuclease [Paenibacillus aurantiacus]|uniref:HNH endonuclease n=1 Tax=Paenibacillus aurantiacus TaxID=1936118 RepID=A0ABV5L0R5_9BACL